MRALNGISAARAGAAASGFLVRPPVCSGPISLLGNAEMRLLTGFRGRLASGVLIGSAFAGVPLAHLPSTGSQPAVVADFRFHPAACGALCEGDNGARLRQPDREVALAAASATIQKRAHAGD